MTCLAPRHPAVRANILQTRSISSPNIKIDKVSVCLCAYLYHVHLQVLRAFDALNPGLRSRDAVSEDPWEVNPEEFKVFMAVPGQEHKRTYTEHVYTISEEDLSDATADAAEIDTEDKTSGEEKIPGHPRKKGRRLFRLCHSRCVQTSCLPIKDVSVYSGCSDDCKLSCTRNILQ